MFQLYKKKKEREGEEGKGDERQYILLNSKYNVSSSV